MKHSVQCDESITITSAIASAITTSRKREFFSSTQHSSMKHLNQQLHQQLFHYCNINLSVKSFIYIDSNFANLNKKYAYSKNKHKSTWIDDLTYLQQWRTLFSIDRRNHMQIAVFLHFHWLSSISSKYHF